MDYRPLGTSGLMVSVVGLGCNAFGSRIDSAQTQAVVDAALTAGITLFDTADIYGLGASEELLGKALGSRRDDVVIATKFGMDMEGRNGPDWGARASRRYVRKAVEASLRRLGTDHIDLYQLHQRDLVTPLEETVEAMNELVDEGKVRYLGCSNFAAWEVVEAHWLASSSGRRPFVSAQNEYSLYNRAAEEELVPALEHLGMALLPYFPLAYGLLTGKYRRGEAAPAGSRLGTAAQRHRLDTADFDRVEALERFAADRGVGILDVALGGLAAQPAVGSVIAGATRPEQVRANVSAGLWQPAEDELAELATINTDRGPGMRHASYALR
ncbi:aldo/keto reductase [Nocardioides mesophilus]|uniref:Aldo/keto reductase n=2 Tax=Nocardioides mesophilus TaxID=433659 RepID=A0A7G9RGS6_9ACTN|nr:aldo/keto reductase [Nocardioides mesophilus]QNN54801.1 aldo/keto reductase [Nocardioides mesophilus]